MTVHAGIGDEVEAYLHGCLADHLAGRALEVPRWAWLNRIAHATADELVAMGSGADQPYTTVETDGTGWAEACRVLARDLLRRAVLEDRPVAAIQRGRIVPLELALASSDPGDALTPLRLVSLVRASLAGHPSAGR